MSDITPSIWQSRIMDAFEIYWTTVNPTVIIASPNREFDRAKVVGTTFVEWDIQGSPDGQTRYSNSVARNHFSREGSMTFVANVKVLEKVALALDLLDAIGLFWETAVIEGGFFRNIGTPLTLGSDGAWYQVSLSTNWLYFTDRSSAPV